MAGDKRTEKKPTVEEVRKQIEALNTEYREIKARLDAKHGLGDGWDRLSEISTEKLKLVVGCRVLCETWDGLGKEYSEYFVTDILYKTFNDKTLLKVENLEGETKWLDQYHFGDVISVLDREPIAVPQRRYRPIAIWEMRCHSREDVRKG